MTEQTPDTTPVDEPDADQAPNERGDSATEKQPPKPEPPKPTETVDFWKQKAREQEGRAKSNADAAKKLKEIEDRDLSELDKAKRDAEQATTRLTEYERTNLRQRVALEKGLPASLVNRLQGATEDEVSADADALMALIKSPATPRPDPSQGARPTSAEEEAAAEYERFYPTPTRK